MSLLGYPCVFCRRWTALVWALRGKVNNSLKFCWLFGWNPRSSLDVISVARQCHICVLLFFHRTCLVEYNLLAPADKRDCCTWSISTNPHQFWTEAVNMDDFSSLLANYTRLFALFETIRTIRYFLFAIRYSLFAIRVFHKMSMAPMFTRELSKK